MKKIVFVSSALQQPRHQKRIDLLKNNYDVEVYFFYRDKYTKNFKNYDKGAKKIGVVQDGKYFSRIILLIKLYIMLLFSRAEIVYCTSPDQALIASFTFKKVILEVGDLYQVDGRNRVYRFLDYFILPRISGLIVTSPYFHSGYFSKFDFFIRKKLVVVENKLPPDFLSEVERYRECGVDIHEGRVRLGLIGNLAFRRSLEQIREFIEGTDKYELHIYGSGLYEIFNGLNNVYYHGSFRSPEDLPAIYEGIDVNVILYDGDNNNVKLALPNKLYESIAFLKPIVCSDHVALADVVRSGSLGEVVVNNDIGGALHAISTNYHGYIDEMKKLDAASFICFEQKKILKLIDRI